MTMVPIYHGIHTNAFGAGGRGFRTLLVGAGGLAAEADRIGRWLQALRPEGKSEGFAANCFRVGGTTYAALARVQPAFAKDEHGREGGLLVHALFAALVEDHPSGHFGKALLDKARSFQKPEVEDAERLDAYLAGCRSEAELEIDPLDPAALLQVDPSWLGTLFAALAARPVSGTLEMCLPVREQELPDALVQASVALPPRLRLGLRWGTGVRPAAAVGFLARSGGTSSGVGIGAMAAGGYLTWLLERLRMGRAGDVRAIVESWNVRSWDGLLEMVARY